MRKRGPGQVLAGELMQICLERDQEKWNPVFLKNRAGQQRI